MLGRATGSRDGLRHTQHDMAQEQHHFGAVCRSGHQGEWYIYCVCVEKNWEGSRRDQEILEEGGGAGPSS